MKNLLKELIAGKTLSESEAESALDSLLNLDLSEIEIAAFITIISQRGVSTSELLGFRRSLLAKADLIDLPSDEIIDVCGTGGDGKDTFNISTLVAFVIASLGYKVAKHGNVSASGNVGSSSILEHLGVKLTNNHDYLKKSFEKFNICFLHAPLFHPALKKVANVRKQLGFRTFFNLLGPLVNPAKPSFNFTGVSNLANQRLYVSVYEKLQASYAVLHDLAGYDELSLINNCSLLGNKLEISLNSHSFKLKPLKPADLNSGGSLESSARVFLNILDAKLDLQVNIVAANAAAVIHAYKPEINLLDLFELAKESIKSGKVKKLYSSLIAMES